MPPPASPPHRRRKSACRRCGSERVQPCPDLARPSRNVLTVQGLPDLAGATLIARTANLAAFQGRYSRAGRGPVAVAERGRNTGSSRDRLPTASTVPAAGCRSVSSGRSRGWLIWRYRIDRVVSSHSLRAELATATPGRRCSGSGDGRDHRPQSEGQCLPLQGRHPTHGLSLHAAAGDAGLRTERGGNGSAS